MKIKDVEKETGISIHTIRFYEEMGLVTISRDPENKYRDFSEGDIKNLRKSSCFVTLAFLWKISSFIIKKIST